MPSTLVESSATAGRPVASARMPSCASARSIGSVRGPHIESTQCAIAFRPLATVISPGSVVSRAASYTTDAGSTLLSTPVVLVSPSVRPQTLVASEPAYVVGTATIGSPVLIATALARPVVEPPPTLTRMSAPASTAARRARPATSTGTCITTSS